MGPRSPCRSSMLLRIPRSNPSGASGPSCAVPLYSCAVRASRFCTSSTKWTTSTRDPALVPACTSGSPATDRQRGAHLPPRALPRLPHAGPPHLKRRMRPRAPPHGEPRSIRGNDAHPSAAFALCLPRTLVNDAHPSAARRCSRCLLRWRHGGRAPATGGPSRPRSLQRSPPRACRSFSRWPGPLPGPVRWSPSES